MQAVVDRILDELVVVEFQGKCYNIPRIFFPADVKEGSVVSITIAPDEKATKKAREEIKDLMEDVWEKDG